MSNIPNIPDGFSVDKSEPKDLKRSIRDKYKRGLSNLRRALDTYIHTANERLGATRAGKIHKRKETEQLLQMCNDLLSKIPEEKLLEIDFDRLFSDSENDTEKIIEEMSEWFNSLSKDELEELKSIHLSGGN